MTNNHELQEKIDELLAKNNQFSLRIQKHEDTINAQEKGIEELKEELDKLSIRISSSKSLLTLLREEMEELSLEIKILLQKN